MGLSAGTIGRGKGLGTRHWKSTLCAKRLDAITTIRSASLLINDGSHPGRVISGETFQFSSQCCALEYVKKRLGCWKFQRVAMQNEVITLPVKRNEIQTIGLRSRLCCHAAICIVC